MCVCVCALTWPTIFDGVAHCFPKLWILLVWPKVLLCPTCPGCLSFNTKTCPSSRHTLPSPETSSLKRRLGRSRGSRSWSSWIREVSTTLVRVSNRIFGLGGLFEHQHQQSVGLVAFLPQNFLFGLTIDFSKTLRGGGGGGGGPGP